MNKQVWGRCDFARALHQQFSVDQPQCLDIVNQLIALMTDELQQGAKITITRFGTFSMLHKKARMGRNPKTKQEVLISARTIVSFRPSSIFKKHVYKREIITNKTG